MKDKEIELKFKINEEIKNKMLKDLEELGGVMLSKSRLIDSYYIPYFRDFEEDGVTIECVRIRENEKGAVLTYKKIHKEANPIFCDEFETKVEDKEQTEKILFGIGFKIQMVIDKTRISYKLNDFEFDFDHVENLGELLEVELKKENGDINEIYEFVSNYGVSEEDLQRDGIQTMMKRA